MVPNSTVSWQQFLSPILCQLPPSLYVIPKKKSWITITIVLFPPNSQSFLRLTFDADGLSKNLQNVRKNKTTPDALVERFCWVLKGNKSWHIGYFLLHGFLTEDKKNWNTYFAVIINQYNGEMCFVPQPQL